MSGNPFLSYTGSSFGGEDGLKWFWGHVTTDAAWREHHKEYGYRVKAVSYTHLTLPTSG